MNLVKGVNDKKTKLTARAFFASVLCGKLEDEKREKTHYVF